MKTERSFHSRKCPPKTDKLTTPYEVGDIPHDYHPTPSFRRDTYTNLNGVWSFRVIRRGLAAYEGTITVPFPPESDLSGVGRITKGGDVLVYERVFEAPSTEGRLLLHFGAVDNEAEVFVNGKQVGHHIGGYLPFTLDITEQVRAGENALAVTVTDRLDHTYPWGKQKYKRGGMWYTPVSGIWQTVWLEQVPQDYVRGIKIDTSADRVTVRVEGGAPAKVLTVAGRDYPFSGESITVLLPAPHLWSPDDPYLYDMTLTAGEDTVHSYFALRTVGTDGGRLTFNGKPYYFHGLLDQGYFPDGIYMPAAAKGWEDDILRMKALGFNMLRKHIKIEPDIFYYLCDKHGMAVFQDMVNNGSYRFLYDTALPTVGLKKLPRTEPPRVQEVFRRTAEDTVALLYNHPCIVYYTIFNEGWGQHRCREAYETLKALDPTRIWDTASGWFRTPHTDVQSEHVYFKKVDFPIGSKPAVLSEFGGYSCNIPGHSFHLKKVYGYKICATPEILTRDLETLYLSEVVPLVRRGLSASVLTQVSDVEDETNGLLTYDRRIVKPDREVMLRVAEAIKEAFGGTF